MVNLLLAASVSLAVSLVGTRFLIDWLRAHRVGQPIREDGPQGHFKKAGTPTMGGVGIVAGALVGYLAGHLRSGVIFTRAGILVMLAIVGGGAVGLVDDWIKVSRERNLGLTKTAKLGGLLVVGVAFGVLAVEWANVRTELTFTRVGTIGLQLGAAGFVVWAVLTVLATTNSVNITDGLDGLAAGSSAFTFMAYTVIAFWAFRHPDVYQTPQALDLAVVAAAMVGACTGFLWWNAAPARIFMGDTGALAIGAGLAALALVTNTHLLLPLVGGIFLFETVSVIIQVAFFKLTRRRVFRMAPVHHHFELGGWPET
ncbi:MAG TPA: phospho-N-acetylmuramoyl-pentapeptide-transferase, partial [Acidimicrobiales bacterium]